MNETTAVLKGVVRIDNLEDPAQYVAGLLSRVKREYIVRTYGIETWSDSEDFLQQYAKQTGKLLRGGEYDLNTVARMVLNDWQRGRLPYFVCPPFEAEVAQQEVEEKQKEKKKADEWQLKVQQIYSKIAVRVAFNAEDSAAPQAMAAEMEEEERQIQGKDGQQDWDAVYDKMEGAEVDTETAEKLLNIHHEEQQDVSIIADDENDADIAADGDADAVVDDEEDEVDLLNEPGEVSEAVHRSMSERRARYHMDADEAVEEEDQQSNGTTVGDTESRSSASSHVPLFMLSASRSSAASPSSSSTSTSVAASGDSRPRSSKNKNRSRKNRKELEKKRKRQGGR